MTHVIEATEYFESVIELHRVSRRRFAKFKAFIKMARNYVEQPGEQGLFVIRDDWPVQVAYRGLGGCWIDEGIIQKYDNRYTV